MDAAETFWQDWVVHYDMDRQLILASRMESSRHLLTGNWWEQGSLAMRRGWAGLLDAGRKTMAPAVIFLTCVIPLFFFGPKAWHWWMGRRRVQRVLRGEVARSDAAILYHRMLVILHKRGYEKPAWLTPAEFARVLPASPTAALVEELTAAYNELRFGGRPEAGQTMIRLLRQIETSA
jgi:hypothetical protein